MSLPWRQCSTSLQRQLHHVTSMETVQYWSAETTIPCHFHGDSAVLVCRDNYTMSLPLRQCSTSLQRQLHRVTSMETVQYWSAETTIPCHFHGDSAVLVCRDNYTMSLPRRQCSTSLQRQLYHVTSTETVQY